MTTPSAATSRPSRETRACLSFTAPWRGDPARSSHTTDLFWYGIHAVEVLYAFMGAGCERVTRTHSPGGDIVMGQWRDGRTGVVRTIREGAAPYGQVVFGAKVVVSVPPPAAAGAVPKRSS